MQFKSALMTDASGSLGGMTASRNRSGLYLRSRVVPVDPATTRQTTMRSIMAALNDEWIELTAAQRTNWNNYAANVEHTPRFCGPIFLTGQNQFIRSNSPRLQAALGIQRTAPVIFDTGNPLTLPTVCDITPGTPDTFTLTVPFVTEASAAGTATLFLGRVFSPSRSYYQGPFQLADTVAFVVDAGDVTFSGDVPDLTTDYQPVGGDHQAVRFGVNYTDGRYAHNEVYSIDWVAGM